MRTFKGHDGSWNLTLRNTPEVGAEIEAALAPLTDQIFHEARLAGRHEDRAAYAADALTEMVHLATAGDDTITDDSPEPAGDGGPGNGSDPAGAGSGTSRPPRWRRRSRRPDTKVIALIDYEALKRGHAEGDETCEIAGVGPVSVATVRSLLADAFGAAIVTNGVDVHTVAHLGRSPSAHQRTALEARGYRCEKPDCGSTVGLEIDHIRDWHYTHETRLADLAWLCRTHHLDKTHRGWRLHGPPGDRRWTQAGPPGPAEEPAADREDPTLFGDPAA